MLHFSITSLGVLHFSYFQRIEEIEVVTGGMVGVTDLEIEEVIEVVIGEMEVDMVVGGTNKVRVKVKVKTRAKVRDKVRDREEVRERSHIHRMLCLQMYESESGLVWCYCTLCTFFIHCYTALTVLYSLLHCAALHFIVVYGDDQAPWDEYEVR